MQVQNGGFKLPLGALPRGKGERGWADGLIMKFFYHISMENGAATRHARDHPRVTKSPAFGGVLFSLSIESSALSSDWIKLGKRDESKDLYGLLMVAKNKSS